MGVHLKSSPKSRALRIADAVGENSFEMVARLLEHDVSVLQALMKLGLQVDRL